MADKKGFAIDETHIFEDRALEFLNDQEPPPRVMVANNREPGDETKPDFLELPTHRQFDLQVSYHYEKYGDCRLDLVSVGWPDRSYHKNRFAMMASMKEHIDDYDPADGVTGYLDNHVMKIQQMGKLYGADEKRVDALIIMYFNGSHGSVDPQTSIPARIQCIPNAQRLRRLLDDRWPALVKGKPDRGGDWVFINAKAGRAIGGSDPYASMFVAYSADKLAKLGLANDMSVRRFGELTRLRERSREAQRREAAIERERRCAGKPWVDFDVELLTPSGDRALPSLLYPEIRS